MGSFCIRWSGPLIFLLVVIGVFQTIFAGARPMMDAVAAAIQTSGQMDRRDDAG